MGKSSNRDGQPASTRNLFMYISMYIYIEVIYTNKKGTHHRDQSTQNWEQGPQALDLSSGGYFPGKHNL